MRMDPAIARYRENAERAEAQADMAKERSVRNQFLVLAAQWRELAAFAERRNPTRPPLASIEGTEPHVEE